VTGVDTRSPARCFPDDFESGSAKWVVVPEPPGRSWPMGRTFLQSAVENKLHVASAGDAAWTDQVVEARARCSFNGSST
jgi:hypothetical protein